ncbi:MAG: hypothetical protein C4341_07910 [Armatimonadota bacterium]
MPAEKAVQGIAGMVVLGNAWESVDMFEALAYVLDRDHATLAYVALLRMEELYAAGKNSLKGRELDSARTVPIALMDEDLRRNAEDEYERLRAKAEGYHQKRAAFITKRLKEGTHSDTDPSSWEGWSERAPLEVRDAPLWVRAKQHSIEIIMTAALLAVISLLLVAAVYVIRRRRAA